MHTADLIIGAIICIAIVAVFIYAIGDTIKDFKTEEGCKGCDGLCLRNGGYCPRKDKYHTRPPKTIYYRLKEDQIGSQAFQRRRVIAVCTGEFREVTSFTDRHDMLLYYVEPDGATSRKVLFFPSKKLEDQMREIRKNHVTDIAALNFTEEDRQVLSADTGAGAGIQLHVTNSADAEDAVEQLIGDTYEKASNEPMSLKQLLSYRMHHLYKRYPDLKTTLFSAIGTTGLMVTFFLVCFAMVVLALHLPLLSKNTSAGIIAISMFLQFGCYFIIDKCRQKK